MRDVDPSRYPGRIDAGLPKIPVGEARLVSALDVGGAESVVQAVAALPGVAQLFELSARTSDAATVGEHTLRAIQQHDRYFGRADYPAEFRRSAMRLTLAFHDAAKGMERSNASHQKTLALIDSLKDGLPFTGGELTIARLLIDQDELGEYLRGCYQLDTTADAVIGLGQRAGMAPGPFLTLLTRYYQSDVSSYTSSAGSKGLLDHLFAIELDGSVTFDTDRCRIRFNPKLETQFRKFEDRVSSAR